jgi:hypothetical protein
MAGRRDSQQESEGISRIDLTFLPSDGLSRGVSIVEKESKGIEMGRRVEVSAQLVGFDTVPTAIRKRWQLNEKRQIY